MNAIIVALLRSKNPLGLPICLYVDRLIYIRTIPTRRTSGEALATPQAPVFSELVREFLYLYPSIVILVLPLVPLVSCITGVAVMVTVNCSLLCCPLTPVRLILVPTSAGDNQVGASALPLLLASPRR